MNPLRIRALNTVSAPTEGRHVLYWMQSAQRADANHALAHAIHQANQLGLPLMTLFVVGLYPDANARHYHFMLEGLSETFDRLQTLGIDVVLQTGDIEAVVKPYLDDAASVVFDDAPMPFMRALKTRLARHAEAFGVPVSLVSTNVIVPPDALKQQCEYAARTIRPKLWRRIEDFLDLPDLLPLKKQRTVRPITIDIDAIIKTLNIDASVTKSGPFQGGERAAHVRLNRFLNHRLSRYGHSADPGKNVTSELSPYLHFGQLSPLAVFLAVDEFQDAHRAQVEAFQEQLLVRRELAFNFVQHCEGFDRFETMTHGWAYDTLTAHLDDTREARYSFEDYRRAATDDPYFNAAMQEMIHTGFMHNTMRMYWGKRIIAWSATPQDAYDTIITLNNAYFLDGRDPSSYAGIAWLFGRHDRAFPPQPVFGKVRSMTSGGLKRKYDMDSYLTRIKKHTPA